MNTKTKHLKWGLLATGYIANCFARGLSTITDHATALGVASRDLVKAKEFATEHKISRAYGSYDELLADPEIDAVYISTPNAHHAEWSMKAARAGKHILCEKPVTINARQLDEVIAVVKECDVFFMEAFMYRCHPQWARVREIIDSGAIGEVRMLDGGFSHNLGGKPQDIRMSNALAGGALMDVGCYCVSFFRTVMNAEPTATKAVGHIGTASGVDEFTAGILQFPAGTVAKFVCSVQCNSPSLAVVYGSSGSILVTAPWFPSATGATIIVKTGSKEESIQIESPYDLYAREALTVAQYLDARQAPAMNWEDSRGQMRALDALRASMGLKFQGE